MAQNNKLPFPLKILQELKNLKQEQTKQDTDIENLDLNKASKTELQEATIALQAELLATKKDLQAGTLEGQEEGESLYLQDSSNARFRSFGIEGNSNQEKRKGYNKLHLKDATSTSNGIETNIVDEMLNISGSATMTWFNITAASQKIPINIAKNKECTFWRNQAFSKVLSVRLYFASGEYQVVTIPANANKITFTSENDIESCYFYIGGGITVGENININNLQLMLYEEIEDKTYEKYGPMPSLEFPSFVQAVGQDVNKLDMSAFEDKVINGVEVKRNEAGEFNIIGTATNNITIDINITEINLKGTHTLSTNKTGDITSTDVAAVQFLLYDTTNNRVMFNSQIVKNKLVEENYTFAETIAIGKARIYIAKGTILDCKLSFKLQEKSKATAYSPYSYGSASVVVENKNKLDFSKWNNISASHGTVEQVENGIKLTATADDCYTNTFAYKFSEILNKEKIENYGDVAKPNTKYTFSCKVDNVSISKRLAIFFADKDGNSISYVTASTSTLTAITPANCRYITTRVSVVNAGDSLTFTDLQLEEDQATDYVEHKEQTLTIDVQQEMLEGDYFDLDNEEEVHTWRKVVFSGNSILTRNDIKEETTEFLTEVQENIKINGKLMSTHLGESLEYKDCLNGTTTTGKIRIRVDNKIVGIGTEDTDGIRISKLKAKLQELYNAGNPLTIYHKLAEPIRLPFTDAQKAVAEEIKQLHSYKGGTHVYSPTDDVEAILNVKYTVDQKAYIQAEINKMQAMILAGEE